MRKCLFLTAIVALCAADFGAFAAPAARGNTRGNVAANTAAAAAPAANGNVSARAGKKQTVVNNGTKTTVAAPAANGNVSARAGKKQTVVNNGAKTTAAAGQVMSARAGATQKVINNGTKIATATNNTVISQECQDAFYGCMDSFCMLDNVSGGRCQCSDRNEELLEVMDEIAKLDEQSYTMATEGVERLKMGENADAIIASAMAAGGKVLNKETPVAESKSTNKSRTLDLSAWNSNIFAEDEEDILSSVDSGAVSNALDKKGNELYSSSAKLCIPQMPEECKASLNMLQNVYAQKIKSDCSAFENSLKQQKIASAQKLQAAEKALRDAALEEFNSQNKYTTTGECVIAFTQCMKTTAECGDDYTGCVTLSAKENIKKSRGEQGAKQTVIKGVVSGADITLAASTMEQLLAKKTICEHITKQCVNANKNDAVWTNFLRNAAPALRSAEEVAEQNLRMECIPNVANCFKEACKSTIDPNNPDGSYDMCLADPKTFKHLCKVQLEPCLAATGGSYDDPESSSLWNGLVATLASMKVDACTQQVKDCLTSENACGPDYSGCVGLDTQSIGNLCPVEKLTACVSDGKYSNNDAIRDYVANIAQGLALNIDNSFVTICQNAAEEALVKACGDGGSANKENSSCPSFNFNFSSLTNKVHVAYYDLKNTATPRRFYDSVDEFVADKGLSVAKGNMGRLLDLKPIILDQVDITGIKYGEATDNQYFSYERSEDAGEEFSADNGYTTTPNEILSEVNSKYNLLLQQIKADPKVAYCTEGRVVQGFDAAKTFGKQGEGRFPNLLNGIQSQLASQVLNTIFSKYNAEIEQAREKLNSEYGDLAKRVVDYIGEAELDAANEAACKKNTGLGLGCIANFWTSGCGSWYRHIFTANYDKTSNKCIVSRTTYYCRGGYTGTSASYVKSSCHVEKEHDPRIIQYPSSKSQSTTQ